jgi:hypothetical protein
VLNYRVIIVKNQLSLPFKLIVKCLHPTFPSASKPLSSTAQTEERLNEKEKKVASLPELAGEGGWVSNSAKM